MTTEVRRMRVAFSATEYSRDVLISAACRYRKEPGEIFAEIVDEWRKKYREDLDLWNGIGVSSERKPRKVALVRVGLPDWDPVESKKVFTAHVSIDAAKDLYPGVVMHERRKSDLLNALIWIWSQERWKEIGGYMDLWPSDLVKEARAKIPKRTRRYSPRPGARRD